MFPTSAFNQTPMAFPFPGQQPLSSLYQSQFGGMTAFNSPMIPQFQQIPPPRGQSVPTSNRPYPPSNGPFLPPPPTITSSSRHQQSNQYPPPAASQHYEYRSSHGSKNKKHHKRRSASPSASGEQGLYSDHEQQSKGQHEQSERQRGHSRSRSPTVVTQSKHESAAASEQQQQQHQQSQASDAVSSEPIPGGVARSEEEQAIGGSVRRKSGSKKKKHHRRDRYSNYDTSPAVQGTPIEINSNIPFQRPYPGHQNYFGEYQNELPLQLRVHRQPLYAGYNQVYEESIQRGDVYRKQAKRSTRLPPEVKQQLLPHEDDHQNQPPSQQPPYPYGPVGGYPQQSPVLPSSGPQPIQPYGTIRAAFNPYQPYGPPTNQPNYYGSPPYNALQPWSGINAIGGSAEQEIQRLRSHIQTLEDEVHKLQRKLNKATLNNNDGASEQGGVNQAEGNRSHRRSKKREVIGSPPRTPVIVELNNTAGETIRESSSKKHRHRTSSNTSSQPASQHQHQQQSTQVNTVQVQRPIESTTTAIVVGSGQNQQTSDAREQVRSGGTQISELDNKTVPTRNPREETAAQLALAAAAQINARQAVSGPVGPPPPVSQQPRPQQQMSGPPPPLGPQVVRPQMPNQQQPQIPNQQQLRPQIPNQQQQPRPQIPNQQQPRPQQQVSGPPPPLGPQVVRPQVPNQQQLRYQQGVLPPQGQQIRGPAPRAVAPGNIHFPNDAYQQQQQQQFINPPQQRHAPNPNYNQSNNNELYDYSDNDDNYDDDLERRKLEKQSRSAEKILDAFERFYINHGKASSAPMKVKYIPEEMNSNFMHFNSFQQRNTNNNNRYRSSSRSSTSSSQSNSIYSNSFISSRHSIYDNHQPKLIIEQFI